MLAVAVDHRPAHAREIQLVDLRGHRRRIDPHPPFPLDGAWSPDGTRIAFSGANTEAGGHGHSYGLYVMNARTRRVRLVYDAPRDTFQFNPSWSPDGRRLAFHGGGGPWVVRVDGRGARKLAANLGVNPWEPPAWSPDGRKLAFGAFNGRDSALYTVRTRGRPRLRRITRKQTRSERAVEAGVSSPAWAPDGRWIAFERFGFASGPELSIVRADGRGERRLDLFGEFPVWAPRGRRIAFVADAARADEGGAGVPVGIGLVDLARKRGTIVANAVGPEWKVTWTADGTRIVFVAGRSRMYVGHPSGGMRRLSRAERKRLRLVPTSDQSWSSTGALLAVEGDFDRNSVVLRTLTPRGVAATVRWSHDDSPEWALDGRKLAFVRKTRTHQIYVLDVATRRARRLARGDDPVWSPNGRWIAFQRRRNVFVVRTSGGRARRVGAGGTPAWSPDGMSLAMGGRGIFVARVGDWKPRRIDQPVEVSPECGPPRPAPSAWSPAWSHDGRALAFTFEAPWCDPSGDFSWFAVVTVDGTLQREFEPIGESPQWAPDDSALYFRDYLFDLYRVRADGSDQKKIVDGPVGWFSLSRDGRLVAYENGDEVWVANSTGSGRRRVLRHADHAQPAWRP